MGLGNGSPSGSPFNVKTTQRQRITLVVVFVHRGQEAPGLALGHVPATRTKPGASPLFLTATGRLDPFSCQRQEPNDDPSEADRERNTTMAAHPCSRHIRRTPADYTTDGLAGIAADTPAADTPASAEPTYAGFGRSKRYSARKPRGRNTWKI